MISSLTVRWNLNPGGSEVVVRPLMVLRDYESYAMAAFGRYGVRKG